MMEKNRRKTTYIIQRDGEYLSAIITPKYEINTDRFQARWSIYRYDAARIPKRTIAEQIIRILRQDNSEKWNIIRFNPLDGVVNRV